MKINWNDYPKSREEFENWLESKDPHWLTVNGLDTIDGSVIDINMNTTDYFDQLPFAMQYGVIVEWLDSRPLSILIYHRFGWEYDLTTDLITVDKSDGNFDTRKEAQILAINKSFEFLEEIL